MSWNELMWGNRKESGQEVTETRCSGVALFRNIARNSLVKIYLHSTTPIEGYFVEVKDGEVLLYDFNQSVHSVITVCAHSVIAVKVTDQNRVPKKERIPKRQKKVHSPLLFI
ncbi:hypothetical protein AJ85_02920 [Alkalihalobacillus alcalophilus ATCC 27647 = CGMCC 1.3604]|uniref:Uncharacterized protein n=1 Tax=Alkalihalobacillus alcalophilus ATCC 27647 = CGMCC 1.3604 TaxID=1218173 RepID=A0A094WN04_ALKAL|nr:hypothetical protein [Alkalihalobacillus alcalophilus]KGA97338.1 hypothetical protein BALCAV_0211065 [Alkalihalobacillus alcalophilus ATCC 27647 = CGMCC 1.3604]MED1561239.1 hypothetical protein [Alkalihalobacillus alcalophilus]THG91714.1 hypothetical protein AJ85_02920 [Alkalihalobacillus alcalophilus ATCC 27647 = CGMCC 1.3604]